MPHLQLGAVCKTPTAQLPIPRARATRKTPPPAPPSARKAPPLALRGPAPRARPVLHVPAPRPSRPRPSGPPSYARPRLLSPTLPSGPARPYLLLSKAPPSSPPHPGPGPAPAPRPRRPFQARWHPANSSGKSTALAARGPSAPARASERRRSRCCGSSGARAPSLDSARPEGVRSRRPQRGVPGGSRGAESSGGAGAPGVPWIRIPRPGRPRRLGRRRCGMLQTSGELRVRRKGKPALAGGVFPPPK